MAFLWRRDDRFDLFDVVYVVAREHSYDVLDSFLTTLGVHSVVLPLFRSKRFQQGKICFADRGEMFQGLVRIAFAVVPRKRPGILIERGDRAAWGTENRAHAVAADDFGIDEMSDDFGDGPFVRCGALAQFGRGFGFYQGFNFSGGGCLDF